MPTLSVATVLQVIVGLGLINVWLIRSGRATGFRGGDAKTLRQEFEAYGLPEWMFYLVGFLKIGSAVALLVGVWMPGLVLPAASIVAVLMLGALFMHVKVSDPPMKSLPAFLVFAMSAILIWTATG